MLAEEARAQSLRVVAEQLETAVAARKCQRCGCLQETIEALENTEPGQGELAGTLRRARAAFAPKEYDCLGCPTCYPAVAANAFTEAYPDIGEGLALCPTDTPAERGGWPPLPGSYRVLRFQAPVAVCTLNDEGLATRLAAAIPSGVAIVGTMRTENLGIERVIRNVGADPHIRFLVLCGDDAQQAIGHLPGQSMASLVANGADERGRIIGARGKRPLLKNVSPEQIAAFRDQVELVDLIGQTSDATILACVSDLAARDPGPFAGTAADDLGRAVLVDEPRRLVPDPAGYFVVYPDAARQRLSLEHYTTAGVLDCVLESRTPAALYAAAIERGLITRLDHAAYLGRELARAEQSLTTGELYVQDRAAGTVVPDPIDDCGCGGACLPIGLRKRP